MRVEREKTRTKRREWRKEATGISMRTFLRQLKTLAKSNCFSAKYHFAAVPKLTLKIHLVEWCRSMSRWEIFRPLFLAAFQTNALSF